MRRVIIPLLSPSINTGGRLSILLREILKMLQLLFSTGNIKLTLHLPTAGASYKSPNRISGAEYAKEPHEVSSF